MHCPFLIYSGIIAGFIAGIVENAPTERKEILRRHFNAEMIDKKKLVETKSILDKMAALAHKTVYGSTDIKAHLNFHESGNSAVSISVAQPGVRLPVAKYLFEGDIILTPNQAQGILDEFMERVLGTSARKKRKVTKDRETHWEMPIPYVLNSKLSPDVKRSIKEAVHHWESQTCLEFKMLEKGAGDYIEFFKGVECYSLVGKTSGRQGISIGGKGCSMLGNIAHEIGHALGMWHEQSRPSANKYIRILEENIINSLLYNFITRSPKEVSDAGVPYDLGSVMHYGSSAFTIDYKKNTIQTLIPGYQGTIGQRENPSFYDVKAINNLYCSGKCNSFNSATCLNGGYPHPNDCSQCLCPNGIGGQVCEKNEDPQNADCGGMIQLFGNDVQISSPGYPDPGYSIKQKCNWLVQAPFGHRVRISFDDNFQFLCTKTCIDYVEVKNATDIGLTGMRFCCFKPPEPILSASNTMLVVFRSAMSSDFGFKATLSSLDLFF